MNTWPLVVTGSLARSWASVYTAGLPKLIRTERRSEIASDLWEQATNGGFDGKSANAIAAHIFGRVVLGMPADIAWHLGELKGENMEYSVGQKSVIGVFTVLGVLTVLFGTLIVQSGIADGWLFSDLGNSVMSVLVFTSIAGPFVAVAGVYAWRRADAEERSTKNARVMVVVGTLGISVLSFLMYWTIVGPIIGAAIVAYWVYKVRGWRTGTANLG
ncbi:MAG: hypothetical protein O3B84_00675 [Chloroflexi bacterium]|nr:hypothetical protein [Chloroflexota bacterium]